MPQGYIRFPDIHQDRIVFVSEDDLWLITDTGGRAERLTAAVDEISHPHFSPDGQLLAFVGQEEGPNEIYIMPALGGPAQRLTYQAADCRVLGWTPTGDEILYSSNAGQYINRFHVIYAISPDGGQPRELPLGMPNAISYGREGGIVLGRNINEPARWKRYRGGTVGHLWCDAHGSGHFQRLLHLKGNLASPCWVGNRIYFLSDHEGIANIYSCTPQGEDVRRHTNLQDFYARNLSSDGKRMVFHAGADLYLFDPASENLHRFSVELPSLRTQLNRKFVPAAHYMDSYALHPQGYATAITTRGKAFTMGNWEGPVIQHGEQDGVRYRMLEWLNDGKRLVTVSDGIGREVLVVSNPEDASEKTLSEIEFGRAVSLVVSPTDDVVAITNHRNELIVVVLESEKSIVVDKSDFGRISGPAWSPDGKWLAYKFDDSNQTSVIKLCNLETGETHFATDPVLADFSPSFDLEGKYLYFLGKRTFNPVRDNLHFDLSFPKGVKPYAIMLRKDLPSPFIPVPKAPPGKEKEKEGNGSKKQQHGREEDLPKKPEDEAKEAAGGERGEQDQEDEATEDKKPSLVIDLEGITSRVLPFPVSEGRYGSVQGIKGKALFLLFPIEGALPSPSDSDEPKGGTIYSYDFETHKHEWLLDNVNSFDVSRDGKTLIYSARNRLRALKAGEKAPKTDSNEPNRESGWLDLNRVKVSIQPASEWKQMFAEAWRVQRDIWDSNATSPLNMPGINVTVGDAVLAINGQRGNPARSPQELLVYQARNEVQLTIESAETKETRVVTVKALASEREARYREWVEKNREAVHTLSNGRVGYIHIPDMGSDGYSKFHRCYLAEYDYPALLVDVRWNGGGNVSSLLLEKLARRRIGYSFSRWGQPEPYPYESPRGPMVALTNEQAGSDGDIFSHSFKLMGLGPLIGMRTWGGVIGISHNHSLVDGTRTTQPEHAFWFKDVGWNVENYGTDPDIEVDIAPQDYVNDIDPQLERAIAEAFRLIEEKPSLEPKPEERPKRGRM